MTTLLLVLIVGFLVLILPLLAFGRASRALIELAELRRELDALARAVRERADEAPPAAAPPREASASGAPAATATPAPPVVPVPSAAPVPPAAPVAAEVVAVAPAAPAPAMPLEAAESLEARIGSRWLLYLGVAAIVIATSYFVKLAFDNRWITEAMRVAIGAVGGVALLWIGGRFVRAGYAVYGQILKGGGIAILYLSIYAAFNFYALISQPLAFGLMALVTGLGAWQADRHQSQGLALMAVGGGFVTPFLVGSRTGSQAALFGYDAILVAGTAALARRGDWPLVNLASYWLTVITVAGWLAVHYTPDAYLQTVLFLTVFCALFGFILAQRPTSADAVTVVVRRVLATAPPLYYVTAVSLLFPHSAALVIFLVAATLTGIVWARRVDSRWGPVVLWLAVAAPLAAWTDTRAGASWLVPGATVILAVYALHLVAELDRIRHGPRPLSAPDILLTHLNGLGVYVLLHLLLDGWHLDWLGAIAGALALWHLYLRRLVRGWDRELPAHVTAIATTLAAVALSAWLGGDTPVIGWAVEAAALTLIGLSSGREWLRLTGAALVGVAAVRLLALLFGPIDANYTVVLNGKVATTLVVVGLLWALAFVHRWRAGPVGARVGRDGDLFALAAHLLFLVLATTEINAFFELGGGGRPAAMAHAASLAVVWTLQGTALVRLGLNRRAAWLQVIGWLVLAVPFGWPLAGRLGLVPQLWLSALANLAPPDGYVVLFNARATAALVLIAALYAIAAMYRRARAELKGGGVPEVAAAVLLAGIATLGLMSAEISAFWRLREAAAGATFEFARQLSLSIAWAAYAAALIFAGIRRRYAPVRYFGIATFLVTILKVLVIDLSELEQLYRVLSVAGLGLLLLVASYLYQRFRDRLAGDPPTPPGAAPPAL